ncbi:MAG: hypothetical protein AAFY71_23035 [Bacteroidota bacterium]
MHKYLILILLTPILMGCSTENVNPEQEQQAWFWVTTFGGVCGCTTSFIFIDGKGQIREVQAENLDQVNSPIGNWTEDTGGTWEEDALKQSLDLAIGPLTQPNLEELRELIRMIPEDRGTREIPEEERCFDAAATHYSALVKVENSTRYKVVYLGSSVDCGNGAREHITRRGRRLLQALQELI